MSPDKPWKAWERKFRKLLKMVRPKDYYYGGADGINAVFLGEAKHEKDPTIGKCRAYLVKVRGKCLQTDLVGIVVLKPRDGQGKETPGLVIMDLEDFIEINNTMLEHMASRQLTGE